MCSDSTIVFSAKTFLQYAPSVLEGLLRRPVVSSHASLFSISYQTENPPCTWFQIYAWACNVIVHVKKELTMKQFATACFHKSGIHSFWINTLNESNESTHVRPNRLFFLVRELTRYMWHVFMLHSFCFVSTVVIHMSTWRHFRPLRTRHRKIRTPPCSPFVRPATSDHWCNIFKQRTSEVTV